MANLLKGFLNNVGKGLTQPKGNLGDFQHAAKLYNSTSHRLAPKTKYLYHVVFNINPAAVKSSSFGQQHLNTINLLVKAVDLPSFKMAVDTVHQYNRKKQVHTKVDYEPINVLFHDDNLGVTTQMWAMYYGYYCADGAHGGGAGSVQQPGVSGITGFMGSINPGLGSIVSKALGSGSSSSSVPAAYKRNTYKNGSLNTFRYGLDNDSSVPFFTSIQIFQLARQQYQSYTLINPIITNWRHEKLDSADSSTPSANTMTVSYESVIYGQGGVSKGTPKGFATEYYDNTPSPLTLLGGGSTSLFGQGGVLGGIGNVLGDLASGKAFSNPGAFLGTLVKGANTIKNVKKLSSAGIKQEGFNVIKDALGGAVGINLGALGAISIPKTATPTTPQTTKALGATSSNTSSLSAKDLSKISTTPGMINSLSNQAKSLNLVPATASASDVNTLLASGNNPKLNGMARRALGQI
jgi:hypothetical protein